MAGLRLIVVVCALTGCSNAKPLPTDIPAPPDAGPTGASTTETFAIDAVFFGEAPLYSGVPSTDAWMNFGYDIDGLITKADSTNVCTPRFNETDGFEGIDNAFGKNVLPNFAATIFASNTPSSTTTAQIRDGARTVLIQVVGLDPTASNATGLRTQIFVGGSFGDRAPSFDSTTDWPVLVRSLNDGHDIAGGARLQFNDSFVRDGTFVSGTPVDEALEIPYPANGFFAKPSLLAVLRIHHAIITFERTSDAPSRLAHGIIAGVLDPTELDAALVSFGAPTCTPTFDTFGEYSDIMRDGTNTADVKCNAISIGIAFTAVQVANPTGVTSTDVAFDPCN